MRQEAWNPSRGRSIKTIAIVAALAVGVMLLIGAATMFGDDNSSTTAQSAPQESSEADTAGAETTGNAGGSTGTLVPTSTPTTSTPATSTTPTTASAGAGGGTTATRTVTVTPPPAAGQPSVQVQQPQVNVSDGDGAGSVIADSPQPSVSVGDVPLTTTAAVKPAPAMYKGCEQTGSRVVGGVKLTGVSEVCAREKKLAAPFVDPDAARKVASVLEGKAPSSVLRAKFVREATARTSVPVAVGDQYVVVDFNG